MVKGLSIRMLRLSAWTGQPAVPRRLRPLRRPNGTILDAMAAQSLSAYPLVSTDPGGNPRVNGARPVARFVPPGPTIQSRSGAVI